MPVRWVAVRPQGAASRVGTQCGSSSSTRAASSRPPGVIVGTLSDGPVRYSDLACAIPGISQRILTLTLKRLQRSGLVDRTAYAEVPPRVEYSLTGLGNSLLTTVLELAARSADPARRDPPPPAHLRHTKRLGANHVSNPCEATPQDLRPTPGGLAEPVRVTDAGPRVY